MSLNKGFKFIDLFSGIGGFHQALSFYGGKCILASDIDKNAIKVYKKNYGIDSNIDIRKIDEKKIPDFDVLCAGFPCQTFSKAGKQLGFIDQTRGTLFFDVARILNEKHPKYIMLENVKNLVSHNNGKTYKIICNTLKEIGYRLPKSPIILSPHQFGVPQVRERVFIPGIYDPENKNKFLEFEFSNLKEKKDNSIYTIVNSDSKNNCYKLSKHRVDVLNAWDEFYKGIDIKTIGFPIWATYFKTKFLNKNFPKWKKRFIKKNQELYIRNKKFIDKWLLKWKNLESFTATEKKFEWQCGESIKSIWEGVIQIRPSGVRVKKPDIFQSLVALVQTPIIGKYKRYLTVQEASRLQSFPDTFIPDNSKQQAYKQFGNSVNVIVVKNIFKKLIKYK